MRASDIESKFFLDDLTVRSYCSVSDSELMMIMKWRNHPDIRRFMFTKEKLVIDEHFDFSRGLKESEDTFYFLVKNAGSPIGSVSITDINYSQKFCYLGIYARPDGAPKGAGFMLMNAICHIVFDIMEFLLLKLKVMRDNERAVSFYQRFGFDEINCGEIIEMQIHKDIYRELYG